MNSSGDPDRWDAVLAPPPGGLEDLRRRLVRRDRHRRIARGVAAAVVLIAAAVAPMLLSPRGPVPASSFEAIALGLAPAPSEPVFVPPGERAEIAVLRLPTHDPRVALYLVGSRRVPGTTSGPD
jgi:hypothetical protein